MSVQPKKQGVRLGMQCLGVGITLWVWESGVQWFCHGLHPESGSSEVCFAVLGSSTPSCKNNPHVGFSQTQHFRLRWAFRAEPRVQPCQKSLERRLGVLSWWRASTYKVEAGCSVQHKHSQMRLERVFPIKAWCLDQMCTRPRGLSAHPGWLLLPTKRKRWSDEGERAMEGLPGRAWRLASISSEFQQ